MDKIQRLIIDKAYRGELAHFFIINSQSSRVAGQEWVRELITSIYDNHGKNIKDFDQHQDILTISPQKNAYKLSEMGAIDKFLQSRPVELDHKFVILPYGEQITMQGANKLLKTLEEPEIDCVFFIITGPKGNMLPTISSRAIQLYLPATVKSIEELPTFSHFAHFAEQVKKSPQLEYQIQQSVFNDALKDGSNEDKVKMYLAYLRAHDQDKEYNNSPGPRLYKLYQLYLLKTSD